MKQHSGNDIVKEFSEHVETVELYASQQVLSAIILKLTGMSSCGMSPYVRGVLNEEISPDTPDNINDINVENFTD